MENRNLPGRRPGPGLPGPDQPGPGCLGVGGPERVHVRPSLSKDQVLQWLHTLRTFRFDEPTSLGARLLELTPSLPHRVLVIVLSDLHDPYAPAALKRVAQEHDCVVLQLRDPAEDRLRGVGFVQAREAETGRPFVIRSRLRGGDPALVEDQLRRAGVDYLLIPTDQPFVSRVRQFFKLRDLIGREMHTAYAMRGPRLREAGTPRPPFAGGEREGGRGGPGTGGIPHTRRVIGWSVLALAEG